MDKLNEKFIEAARRVKLLLMDCDGVLTDGRLYFNLSGEELKVFHVRDGQGLVMWHKAGFRSGIITGRKSDMLKLRTEELGVNYLIQNSQNKVDAVKKILAGENLKFEDVAYIGDDLGDLDVLKLVGVPVVVADCATGLSGFGFHKTLINGGFGAVRELIDFLLGAKI